MLPAGLLDRAGCRTDGYPVPPIGTDAAQVGPSAEREHLWADHDPERDPALYGGLYPEKGTRTDAPQEPVKLPDPAPLFQPLIPLKPQYSDLPSFPVECLPANLRDYVTAVAEHSQTAPDMAAVISLGVLAVCLQGKYQVEGMPGYVEPLSLYTVVIAAPGERKSSVMRDMTGVIYEYEKEFNQAREAEIRANRHEREALQRQISALEKRLERKSTPQLEQELQMLQNQLADYPVIRQARFTADDCSSEALTSLLAGNGGRFAVISTEGGIFDIMAGRYSSKVNIDVWLKGHCGDAIRVDRLGRDAEYIPHPALSAILSIQPSVLDEIMANATMTGRGLIARFLYASPPSRIGKRVFVTSPIAPEVTAAYKSLVFRLMAIPAGDEPATLRLSDQATETIAQCFAQHEQYLVGEGQEISDWANKYIGTVLRIAGLLHAAQADEISSDISSATMENAIRIGQYFLAHARYAYSVMGTDLSVQKAQFVLAKIMKRKVTEIKRSELFQMCRGKFFKKTEDLFPTLELLEDRGISGWSSRSTSPPAVLLTSASSSIRLLSHWQKPDEQSEFPAYIAFAAEIPIRASRLIQRAQMGRDAHGSRRSRIPLGEPTGTLQPKDESVIVGYYTFAESAVSPASWAQTHKNAVRKKENHGKKRRRGSHRGPACEAEPDADPERRKPQRTKERELRQSGRGAGAQPDEHPLQAADGELSGDVQPARRGRNHLNPGTESGRGHLRGADLRCELRLLPQPRRV